MGVQLSGMGDWMNEVQRLIGGHMDKGMELANAAKSAAIRVRVPKLDTSGTVGQPLSDVAGLDAAERLRNRCIASRDQGQNIP